MAISYVGAVSGNNINGGNVTLDLSGLGLAQGDIVLLAGSLPVTSGGGTSSSGWTSISTDYGSSFGRGTLLYKFMGPSPDTSVVGLGSGDASDGTAWIAVAFRGTEPSQTSFGFGSATTGTGQPNPPSVSVPVNDCAVVVLGHYVGSNVHDTSVTQPSGYTLAGNNSGNDTDDAVVAAAYLLGVASGSEDPGAWSNFTTNALNAFGIGATIYLAPRSTALELDADGGTYALTGAAAGMDIERGLGAGAGVYSLSGAAAAVLHGRYIAAAGGSYSLTGAIAALLRHRSLAADAGTYALVGSAATLLHGGRFLAAGAGSYGLSGTAAALLVDRIIGAGGGVYSLTGADATMGILSDRVLGAGGGVYELTGLEASLGLEGALAAQPGVYAITGAPADAMLDRLLASGNTTYELVGDDADQVLDRLVAASAGSYLLSGADVGLSRVGVRTLEAQPGLYVLTGAAAGLSLAFNGIRAESGGYLIDGQPVSLFFVEKPDPVRRVLHVTRASRTAHVSRNNRTLFVPRRSN